MSSLPASVFHNFLFKIKKGATNFTKKILLTRTATPSLKQAPCDRLRGVESLKSDGLREIRHTNNGVTSQRLHDHLRFHDSPRNFHWQ